MKPIALLALPVYWRPWDLRMPALVAAVIALFYLPYLPVGWKVLGCATGYVAEEGYKASGRFWYPDLLQFVTGPVPGIRRIYMAAAGLGLAALALRIAFEAPPAVRSGLGDQTYQGLVIVGTSDHLGHLYASAIHWKNADDRSVIGARGSGSNGTEGRVQTSFGSLSGRSLPRAT